MEEKSTQNSIPQSHQDLNATFLIPELQKTVLFSPTQNTPSNFTPPLYRYETRHKLGQGGMGEVTEVFDRDLQRNIAMKHILPQYTQPLFLEKFLLEAQVTAKLEHPHIIPIYDFGKNAQHQVFYTMKLVQGISLREVLEGLRHQKPDFQEKYRISTLLRIFIQVCHALTFAHTKGILHRDLKPENIMLGDFGEVMVVDWGLAYSVNIQEDSPSKESGVVGTLLYMSPEQMREESNLTPQSDIYSLGIILFELVAFQHPLSVNNALEAIKKTLEGEHLLLSELVPSVPLELEKIVEKCLKMEPKERYSSASELIEDIEYFLEDRLPKHIPISKWQRLLSLYTRKQNFIRGFTPMDVDFIGLSGTLLGIAIGAYFDDFFKPSALFLFIVGWIVLFFPVKKMLSRQDTQFSWFDPHQKK